jgi:hypothetical protein
MHGPTRTRCRSLYLLLTTLALLSPRGASATPFNAIRSEVSATFRTGQAPVNEAFEDESRTRLSHVHEVGSPTSTYGAANSLVADTPDFFTLKAAAEAAGYIFAQQSVGGGTIWEQFSVRANATASDGGDVSIALPGMETIGSFQFFYDIEGSLYHALRSQFAAYEVTRMLAGASLIVMGNGEAEELFAESFDILFQETRPQFFKPAGGPVIRDYAMTVKSSRFSFQPNTYFPVSATLNAYTMFAASHVDGEASLDFLNGAGFDSTATLRGLAIFDADGHPITDAIVTTRDGRRIAVIGATTPPDDVPEPTTVLLLWSGWAGAVLMRRGRPRRA